LKVSARESLEAQRVVLAAPDYETLRARLARSDCRLCALAAGRTRLVVDRGNPVARILAVGEGPGAEEDRRGLAFVGRSGRLLDELLREAGLEPERDVLIANVVKCRPPDNRPPRADEAASCLPYLRRQIELVAPRFLLLLGATAARHLLAAGKAVQLQQLQGRLLALDELPGIEVLVTFHPAYVLRSPAQRPRMLEHLKLLARLPGVLNGGGA
jgi:uracil-DNA glycosylase family 4